MKLITFTVPCYNSADYMDRCIATLLRAGSEAEILLIDDGSTDETGAIADRYAERFPGVVRAFHQPNGGHGAGVNRGLSLAAGLYFKVVDSDDWLDGEALDALMARLRRFASDDVPVDLVLVNYVYEHAEDSTCHRVHYRNALPIEQTFSWNEAGCFGPAQFIGMHAVVYRTDVLRRSGIHLPEHTFYVDNLFVYQPLPAVHTLYYIDVDLYRYFIGRSDQSVTEQNLIRRIDQHIRVTRLMADCHDLEVLRPRSRRLAKYMYHYLSMMLMICTIYPMMDGTEECLEKSRDLWRWLKQNHPAAYRRMRYLSPNVAFVLTPGRLGRSIDLAIYRQLRKIYKFN